MPDGQDGGPEGLSAWFLLSGRNVESDQLLDCRLLLSGALSCTVAVSGRILLPDCIDEGRLPGGTILPARRCSGNQLRRRHVLPPRFLEPEAVLCRIHVPSRVSADSLSSRRLLPRRFIRSSSVSGGIVLSAKCQFSDPLRSWIVLPRRVGDAVSVP